MKPRDQLIGILLLGLALGYALARYVGPSRPVSSQKRNAASSRRVIDAASDVLWLGDFESENEIKRHWKLRSVIATRTTKHATHGQYAAKLTFQRSNGPAFRMEESLTRGRKRRNWSSYDMLSFDIFSAQEGEQRIILQLKDKDGRVYKEDLFVKGQSPQRITVPIGDLRDMLDLSHMAQFNLFRWKPKSDATFYIDAISLRSQESGAQGAAAAADETTADADVTPQDLGGIRFAEQIDRWRVSSLEESASDVHVPLSIVGPRTPLSVGFPLTGGVPFALGQLQPEAPVALRDPQGASWPLQTRALATWKDGSVKWLQVTTALPPEAQGRQLELIYGMPEAASIFNRDKVRVEDAYDAVTVVTGPLRLVVSKRRFTLFESVAVDRNGDGVFTDDEQQAGGGDLVVRYANREFHSSQDTKSYELVVEESGPLRATLKASGWFRDSRGKGFGKFAVRLQLFAGLPQVRVYDTFIYTGYPANTIHHEYKGLKLPKNEAIQEIRLELPVRVMRDGKVITGDEARLYTLPLDEAVTISQLRADSYTLSQGAAVTHRGTHNAGWALVQNQEAGVMVGVRDAWQQYPKELLIDPATERVVVKLWPESAGELSFETGPAAYGPDAVARGSAFGLAKTHELIFGFLGVPIPPETAQAIAGLWHAPWLLTADPAWMEATDVWGSVGPPQWKRAAQVEQMLDALLGWAMRQPKDFGWYGMLDYGDTLLWYRKDAYDKSYDEWGWHPEGRWGWHNSEAVGSHGGAFMQFMRTHDLRAFQFAEAKARHVMDIDTIHYNTVAHDPRLRKIPDTFSKVGSMHRHNAYHWGGRNEEATHTSVTGLLMYYYLTGYDRARDVIGEVGGFLLQDPVTYTKHPDIAPLRAIANVLWGDVQLYEATWEKRYREAADRWIHVLLKGQRSNGTWKETYDPRGKGWTGKTKRNYITLHTLPALIAYHRLTGNPQVGEAIVKATRAMIQYERYLPFFDALAYSYLLTGDGSYLDEGMRRLRNVARSQQRSADRVADGMIYDKIIYDRVGPMLYSAPFLLGAMDMPDYVGRLARASKATSSIPATAEASVATGTVANVAESIPYDVIAVSSLEKVLAERGSPVGTQHSPLRLQLARNEYESAQLVLYSENTALDEVSIEIKALQHTEGKGVIPRAAITWSPVGFVKTRKPGYAVSHVGWWPDPLPGPGTFTVPAKWPQPVWLTVYASPDTPAGTYTGNVTIHATNAADYVVRLNVTVWDFTLPKVASLKSAFDVYVNRLESCYREFFPEWWARWKDKPDVLARRFYASLVRYRLAPMLNVDLQAPGAIDIVRGLRSQGLSAFGLGKHSGSFDNNWPETPADIQGLQATYRMYAQTARDAGLLKAAYIYTYDEPKPGLPRVAAVARMIHKADPELKNLVAIGHPLNLRRYADWLTDLDILAFRNVILNPAQVPQLKALGKEVWMYVSGPSGSYPSLVIDYPSMAYRILPWMCWKYDLNGLLYWSVNYWRTNPYKNPSNTKWAQNGNGSLYYPGPDGPVPSIRLEVLRDGMEDYEYLALLRDLLGRAKERPELAALVRRAEQLLAIDPALVKSLESYTKDGQVLLAERQAIAELIQELRLVSNLEGAEI